MLEIIEPGEYQNISKLIFEGDSLFQRLFENSADASLLLEGDVIIACNEAAVNLLGYTNKEQLLSVHPSQFSPERQPDGSFSHEKTQAMVVEALKHSSVRFEWQHRRRDGQDLLTEVLLTTIPFQKKVILHSVLRDISERKRAIEALEAQAIARTREIEHRRQMEQLRQRELQTVLAIMTAANSSLDLDEMLTATLDRLIELIETSRAAVLLKKDGDPSLSLRLIRPHQTVSSDMLADMFKTGLAVLESGQPKYAHIEKPGVFLPLKVGGRVLGVLDIIGASGSTFNNDQIALFEAIADQLGLALEQSRLYEQAEQAAVAAERSRLARDLHDSVTQTLFSASIIAEVLPRLWERNQPEAQHRLAELQELTRGASAEMRTLLLELRPVALEEASLQELLQQITEATIGRARIPINLHIQGDQPIPPSLKTALYRITQEALNNVVKHAAASKVNVTLYCQSDRVTLSISDDGKGFHIDQLASEHLGLGIMYERADAVLATLKVNSQMGQGTQITVTWTASDSEISATKEQS